MSKISQLMKVGVVQLSLLGLASLAVSHHDPLLAYAVLSGGLVHSLPSVYFACYALKRGDDPYRMLLSLYKGQVGKFILTGVGFAIVFVVIKPVSIGAVFIGFVGSTLTQFFLVAYWLGAKS